ncbi:MAG: GGDEF domain-containing protein [Rhizobiaceae bacterium]
MGGQVFISLLNPAMGVLLASAFLFLWLHRRTADYLGLAAAGYAFVALGFFIQDVGPELPSQLHRIPSNVSFLLAAYLLSAAVLRRFGLAVPHRWMTAIVLAGTAGLCWFLLADPSLPARIYVISIAIGVIFTVTAKRIRRAEKPHLIDHLLFWLCVLIAVNYLLRPSIVMWWVGSYETYDGFQQSAYWALVQVSQAIFSTMLALALMVSVALELMGDLRQEAQTDTLSGLLNRRGFEEHAAAALARAAGGAASAALLVADLDHFKSINDSYGHVMGDQVIATFGDVVRQTLGEGMVAGRIGGEEFAVLMTGTDMGLAMVYAERIRLKLVRACGGFVPGSLQPSVSIGLCMARPGASLHDLFREADQALYQAKSAGRNRIHLFAEPSFAASPGARGGRLA